MPVSRIRKRKTLKKDSSESRYRMLINIIRSANDKLDPDKIISAIMDNIQKMIPCEAWSILLLSPDQEELIFERAYGTASQSLAFARLRVGEGIAGWVAKRRVPVIVNDVARDKRFNPSFDRANQFRTRSILCAPLLSRNELLGVVELINRKSKSARFTRKDLSLVSTLLGLVSVSLHNALLFRETEKLTITDDLTKLYNNRYINQFLDSFVEEHRKKRKNFSVIFLDLDGFKSVNDQFGHIVGGRTLVEVGKVILHGLDSSAIVARFGGDEFVVVLPGANATSAREAAEGLRETLLQHHFDVIPQKPIRLSASFGIAVFPDHANNLTELIQKADRAMYQVKFSGKNAIQFCNA